MNNPDMKCYNVWVGGEEANFYPLTKKQADELSINYIIQGYDDVVVDSYDYDELVNKIQELKHRRKFI